MLAALVVVTYLPSLRAGYIWDDDGHLTENPCVTGGLGFKAIWTSSRAFYYPLVVTTFWVVHKIVGLNPLPYHLLNILLHAACAILLWRVLRQLQVRGAWLGATLWALHPVMVESVSWITELKNTQSGVFYLLSILFFLKADARADQARPDRSFIALSLVFFALASVSKTSTVMLPVVLGLCLWWRQRNLFAYRLVLAPFFLISIAAGAWTIWEQKFHSGAHGAEWSETFWQRFAIAGDNIWFYVGKLLWPARLTFIYPRWQIDPHSFAAWLPTVVAILLLLLLWRKRNAALRPISFAAAYLVVSLFPVLGFFNVYFFRYSFVGDHFQYLASMGPLALVSAGLVIGSETISQQRRLLFAVSPVLLLVLSTLSWRQQADYEDIETLWHATVAKNPNCWLAHTNLGILLKNKGDIAGATAHYRVALAVRPEFPEALNALGVCEATNGDFEKGMAHFRAALAIAPKFTSAWFDLGNAFVATGKIDDAIAAYRRAIGENSPVYVEANNALAVALSRIGKSEEAIPYFLDALKVKPNDAGVHNNFGFALAELEHFPEAIEQLNESIRINPNAAQTYVNLGQVYARMGKIDDAIANFRRALTIQPNHAEAKFRLREMGVSAPD